MDDTLEMIVRILAIIIGTSTVIGLGAKYVALPWLKVNLIDPVQEVNTQVTVNSHMSDPATMLDTVHTIESKLADIEKVIHQLSLDDVTIGAATGTIQRMWDHHLEWSENEVNRIWAAIGRIENRGANNEQDGRS